MKLNQKGFTLLSILLVIVVIGIVGGTGFYVYKAQKDTKQSLTNVSTSNNASADTTKKQDNTNQQQQTATPKPAENKNPGYVTIVEWGVAARIGNTANSEKLTYRIAKDEYGDDTAYFLLTENVSKNCREVGLALHRKTTGENSKYAKIGQGYYTPSATPMSMCDKFANEQKAIVLLNELSASLDKYDYEFKASN